MQSLNESLNMCETEDGATVDWDLIWVTNTFYQYLLPMQLPSTFSIEWKRYRPIFYFTCYACFMKVIGSDFFKCHYRFYFQV